MFLWYALYAGWIWKGDVLIADLEELETMDAWEIYSERLNAKDVIFPKQGEFIFPIADGRIKTPGRDQELRTSTLVQHWPIQGESNIDFLGESQGSLPQVHDSFPDVGKGRNDFGPCQEPQTRSFMRSDQVAGRMIHSFSQVEPCGLFFENSWCLKFYIWLSFTTKIHEGRNGTFDTLWDTVANSDIVSTFSCNMHKNGEPEQFHGRSIFMLILMTSYEDTKNLHLVVCMVNVEWRSDLVCEQNNSHSWVRIFHGLCKSITNLNNKDQNDNEQETSEIQF